MNDAPSNVQATTARTATALADLAFGDRLDASNWLDDGPWGFDDAVFEAAFAVRLTLTREEEDLMNEHVGELDMYYRTLEALRGRPGGRNFVTARLIVAMYWRMEVMGLPVED